MAKKNDELLKKLLATFRVEADDHLKAMSSALLALEKGPVGGQQTDIVEKIFREAHSLKGAARAVNLTAIESVCQSLESVFAGLKGNRIALSPPLFDLLYQTIDALTALLASDTDASGPRQPLITTLTRRLDDALNGTLAVHETPIRKPPAPDNTLALSPAEPAATVAVPAPTVAPGLTSATVRVSTGKLDAVMRQVEELLSPRLAAAQRAQELRETAATLVQWRKGRVRIQPALRMVQRSLERGKINGSSRGAHEIPKLLESLDAESLLMKTLEGRLLRLSRSAEHDQRTLVGITDTLLHDVKEMHMLPCSSLLEIFPRFTRELARDQGKEVELVIKGGEIEIDRRLLEGMRDPLIHLLRNAIDHGIEQPAMRTHKGRPRHGTITLSISQQDSGKVEILVTDDGVGIDTTRVKATARKLGLLADEEAETLDEQRAQSLVFQSGITTSPIITDLSGRGLGLAIVWEKVERLGGTVALESHRDAGTSFRITLPLTLATFRGVVARAGEHLHVIPSLSVERVARVAADNIRTVQNRETIALDGQAVALVWLSDVLGMPHNTAAEPPGNARVVVLGSGPARIAFRVDEVLGEQEVLVKAFGRQLARVRNVAGASVLGTGQVVPVLNVSDLMKSAVRQVSAPHMPVSGEKPAGTQKRSILVVEDSITSRTLLKSILETAGYRVTTAVDGIDAYTTLKTGRFDLIVSDVDMPRMNGFGLTAKVRGDKQLAELPIVLVTALDSREDRERGIEVGANAYIVKSSFDQSNLLEVIQRLI